MTHDDVIAHHELRDASRPCMPRRLITENTLLKPIFTVMLAIVTACAQPTATLPSSPQPASQAAEAKPNNEGTLEQPKESVVIDPALLKASSQVAPDTYRVKLVTTKGDMLIRVERSWAPKVPTGSIPSSKLAISPTSPFFAS